MNEDEHTAIFRKWVEQYTNLMARVARAYTHTEQDCEDLIQEILFQLWRSIPRFEHKAAPSTWIYRVALNTALAWQRKERKRQVLRPLMEIANLPEEQAQPAPDAHQIEQLYAAIRRLPKAEAALVLLYLDDLSYREISEVLGLSEANVGVKLNRAKKALAEIMKGLEHE